MGPGSFRDTVKLFQTRGMTHAKAQNRVSWSGLKGMNSVDGQPKKGKK